ncbi:hypothetical protein [Sanguibacter sp. HDW7]|uniref:hypothetical protein n=1 Tax=Sanguibacter sp. HDW7 TaxID=2714931 RepID=UPI001409B617|nr:hypothetical protein [Sanguibacter sp. HDW7]QIK82459.1 hypothetical protein G7063_01630 [Sanguibacter sp. HDW7]
MTSISSARTCSTHRPAGARHDRTGRVRPSGAEALVASFDMALASPLPADFFGQVSKMLSPFEPAARLTSATMQHLDAARLTIEALLAIDTPGSTAALHLMTLMACDRGTVRRSQDELAARRTPVPPWVERFVEMSAASPVRLVVDPVRRTETLVVGAHLAGIDLAAVHMSLADLGLDPADLDSVDAPDAGQDDDLALPPLPVFDAFTFVVTLDASASRSVPLEVLLVQHRHDSLAARLCEMDGPASKLHEVTADDAHEVLESVLDGTDQVVALDEDSTAVLPLLRCLTERLVS